jgi:predicted nucleic acid-binding protein
MKDKAFIDTNILVYLYSEDEVEKRICALNALERFNCITSTQALNEFSNVCLKKLHIPADIVRLSIDEILDECEITLIDCNIIQKALTLHDKYRYSYYDSLTLASSLVCQCKYLLTED